METIYLVQVGNIISSVGYRTLEEAQEFVKSRVSNIEILDDSQPYYSALGRDIQMYTIIDVKVEK